MHTLRSLLAAITFLTRIPLPSSWTQTLNSADYGRAMLFYPLVGLLIGGLLLLTAWLFSNVLLPLQAAIVLSVWVSVTGGLHLDGLADTADAWIGGMGDRERSLEIMRDPYCGPMGVLALVSLLLLKFTALQVILDTQQIGTLVWLPVIGRSSVLALFLTTPYVRESGLGSALIAHLSHIKTFIMLFITILAVLLCLGWLGGVVFIVVAISVGWWRYVLLQRWQGMTGDTLGAAIEITEMIGLVVMAVMLS